MKDSISQLAVATLILSLLAGCKQTTETIYYVHSDHLNAPTAVTDQNKAVVWEGHRKPFGETEVTVALIEQNIRFPGQYFDEETGLHYNYFRDYDPSTGRYLESDPIGLMGGLNTYAYVGGNPLKYTDSTGQCPVCLVGVVLAGTAISLWWQNSGGPNAVYPGNGENFGGPAPWTDPYEARRTQKERATDKPSWVDSYSPRGPNESCGEYAERLLNDHYGCDDPRALKRGGRSEHSKIKKWCERSHR